MLYLKYINLLLKYTVRQIEYIDNLFMIRISLLKLNRILFNHSNECEIVSNYIIIKVIKLKHYYISYK